MPERQVFYADVGILFHPHFPDGDEKKFVFYSVYSGDYGGDFQRGCIIIIDVRVYIYVYKVIYCDGERKMGTVFERGKLRFYSLKLQYTSSDHQHGKECYEIRIKWGERLRPRARIYHNNNIESLGGAGGGVQQSTWQREGGGELGGA